MRYYIGIDIGGTGIKGGVVTEEGVILVKKSVPTDRGPEEIPSVVAALCQALLSECGLCRSQITAVGMGVPGTVDSRAGIVRYSNNIPFDNLPLVDLFRQRFDVPTYIGNDANAAALGEMCFGSGHGMESIVFVTLGTGVGTGIIVDGKLLEGVGGAGAEGGHMCLTLGGELCTCGRRGCWEAYASVTALKRQTAAAAAEHPESELCACIAKDGISGETAFNCDRKGDPTARQVVRRYLGYVAAGITNLVNIFRPECVLIGGGLSNEEAHYFDEVAALVNSESFGHTRNAPVPVKPALLRNDAGILGAVGLALAAAPDPTGRA